MNILRTQNLRRPWSVPLLLLLLGLLTVLIGVGKLFPRGDRSPMIEPVSERRLRRAVANDPSLDGWQIGRTRRISRSFYISQAMELVRA
jgi:magnesium-protoporphyrin O-methyltransferase